MSTQPDRPPSGASSDATTPFSTVRWSLVTTAWALAIGAVLAARNRRDWDAYLAIHRWMAEHGVPAVVRNFDSLVLYTLPALLGAFVATRLAGGTITGHLGLRRGRQGWGRVVLLALVPMVGGGIWLANFRNGPPLRAGDIGAGVLSGVIRAPIMEELLYRGLLIGVTAAVLTWSGWRFWTNAVLAALLFASTHIDWTPVAVSQGWPTLLVTGMGGLWYAWLVARWQTLWVPMILHAGMNLGWMLAGARGGAGGGGLAENLLRVATITIATWLTVRMARRSASGTNLISQNRL